MPQSSTADDLRDELLVVRCRRQDAEAWADLVDRHHRRLTYFVRRLVETDAVDAVLQETWVGVLRGLRSLKPGQRFRPWLYAIARNQAMLRLRKKYAEATASLDAIEMSDADDGPARLDNAELVHHALTQLPVAQREILTLFFLDDLSVAETADVLAVPIGTVKSRLARAKAQLAVILRSSDSTDEVSP